MNTTTDIPAIPKDFSELDYLASNPDVAAAVADGTLISGASHWLSHGWREGRPLGIAPIKSNPLQKFETRAPSPQTAVELFRDHWASDLSSVLGVQGSGAAKLFTDDLRPTQAARTLGWGGRLDGMSVLEIGPLEAAHTCSLEQLGASSITAIESNGEAFLKCLIIKELMQLKSSRFLFGDIIGLLESEPLRYDLVLCSGVLYHMQDPIRLIELICRTCDKCFIWTHYYCPDRHVGNFTPSSFEHEDLSGTYWVHTYGDKTSTFWGGNKAQANWLERDTIFRAFSYFGLDDVVFTEDMHDHPNGPAMSFAVRKKR